MRVGDRQPRLVKLVVYLYGVTHIAEGIELNNYVAKLNHFIFCGVNTGSLCIKKDDTLHTSCGRVNKRLLKTMQNLNIVRRLNKGKNASFGFFGYISANL